MTIDISEIKGYMGRRNFNNKKLAKALGIAENTLRSYFKNPSKTPHGIIEKMIEILSIPEEEAWNIFFKKQLT